MSKIIITLNDDASVKTDAREVEGSEAEIMELLEVLAVELDGELTVEKHVHSHHHHHSHDEKHRHKH